MALTTGQFIATIVVAIASGTGIAALFNGGFAAWLDKRQREREVEDREYEEERERQERFRLLRERSRDAHLEEVVDIVGFLRAKQAEHAEHVSGLFVHHQPPPPEDVSTWSETIVLLRRMALIHFDPDVRTRCDQTVSSIEAAWIEMVAEPNVDDIEQWIEWLRESAELMHKGALN